MREIGMTVDANHVPTQLGGPSGHSQTQRSSSRVRSFVGGVFYSPVAEDGGNEWYKQQW